MHTPACLRACMRACVRGLPLPRLNLTSISPAVLPRAVLFPLLRPSVPPGVSGARCPQQGSRDHPCFWAQAPPPGPSAQAPVSWTLCPLLSPTQSSTFMVGSLSNLTRLQLVFRSCPPRPGTETRPPPPASSFRSTPTLPPSLRPLLCSSVASMAALAKPPLPSSWGIPLQGSDVLVTHCSSLPVPSHPQESWKGNSSL